VERSTEAIAEPRKARPLAHITGKNDSFLQFGCEGERPEEKRKELVQNSREIDYCFNRVQAYIIVILFILFVFAKL
jgi:hypothetical protein